MKNNQVALVTGASSGIGEALCRELIKKQCSVIGIARSTDKLQKLKQELGESFTPISCDVSQKTSIEETSKQILAMGFCPNLFFLNAGIAGEQALENPNHFDVEKHEQIMAVNYFGVLRWIECWTKPCQQNDGANFIVTSSVNAILAPKNASAYAASKAAISKAFEGLSLTYYGTNLTFSVVYPGPVATAGLKGNLPFTWKPEAMAKYMIRCAAKRKTHNEPSVFYSVLTRCIRLLPYKWSIKIFKD